MKNLEKNLRRSKLAQLTLESNTKRSTRSRTALATRGSKVATGLRICFIAPVCRVRVARLVRAETRRTTRARGTKLPWFDDTRITRDVVRALERRDLCHDWGRA